jgi:hypothetical protein
MEWMENLLTLLQREKTTKRRPNCDETLPNHK